jgi:glutathione S-transferase
LVLPALPESKEELQECLAWLYNVMNQVGRTMGLAKRKLENLEGGELQRERAARRKLKAARGKLLVGDYSHTQNSLGDRD